MWKIKLLGLVVLLIGVSGCESKFPSISQAMEKSQEWESEGKRIEYKHYGYKSRNIYSKTVSSRIFF